MRAKSLFRNSACVGERVATAPGIARKHPDQLVASTSLAKRRLQLNKRSTVLPLRSCSSRAPCTRAMNSETDSKTLDELRVKARAAMLALRYDVDAASVGPGSFVSLSQSLACDLLAIGRA